MPGCRTAAIVLPRIIRDDYRRDRRGERLDPARHRSREGLKRRPDEAVGLDLGAKRSGSNVLFEKGLAGTLALRRRPAFPDRGLTLARFRLCL